MKNLTALQINALQAINERSGVIVQAKPGAGKTRVILEAIAREGRVHVIYCSTPQIAYAGLPQELKKWRYKIKLFSFENPETRDEQIRLWRIHGGILAISIQSLHRLPLPAIPAGGNAWFVLDESTLTKRPGGVWAETAQDVAARCCKRILLTGTFRSNELHHVYKQAAIAIGNRNEVVARLGRFETWKRKHFYVKVLGSQWWMREKLIPKPDADRRIIEELGDLLMVLDQPQETMERAPRVVEHVVEVGPVELPPTYIFASPTEVSFVKLQQGALGLAYYGRSGAQKRRKTVKLHTAKLDAIKELLERHRRAIYVYTFDHERDAVAKLAQTVGLKTKRAGGRSRSWITEWNNGKIDVLLLHPRSAGHGVNLQFGGNIMIWGVPTPDYEAYAQTIARLARPGQPAEVVEVFEMVTVGTIDVIMREARQERLTDEKVLLEKWRDRCRESRPVVIGGNDEKGGGV